MRKCIIKILCTVILAAMLLLQCACFDTHSSYKPSSPTYAPVSPSPAATPEPFVVYNHSSDDLIDTEAILETAKKAMEQPSLKLSDYDDAFCSYLFNRVYLSRYCKTDDLKRVAVDMYISLLTSQESYKLPDSISLTAEEMKLMFSYILADCPELMNPKNSYTIYTYEDTKRTDRIEFKYMVTPDEYYSMLSETFAVIEGIIAQADGQSAFSHELIAYNNLIQICTYVKEGDNVATAYGALCEGEALCEGYSDAFTLMMLCMGFKSTQVCGTAINSSTSESEPHAWNIVCIDDSFYYTDPTWDDYKSDNMRGSTYSYMNIDAATIAKTHVIDETYIVDDMPACDEQKYNYHSFYGLVISQGEDINAIMFKFIDDAIESRTDGGASLLFKCESESDFNSILDKFSDIAGDWNSKRDYDFYISSIRYSYDMRMLTARYELYLSSVN